MSKKFNVADILFWVILITVFISRFVYLGSIPGGINQDEAFAGYEAWSMSKYGIDSWGYTNPIYFISWGSGMNVFYSYLLRVFFYFLDAKTWVLRLPQAILGVLSCYIFYRSLKICYNKKTALIGFLIIAIIPWHIVQSRWGLESSACTFGMLTGFYFYLKALKKIKYLYLSVLFYSIALYSYAITWVPIFFIALFSMGYLWYIKKSNFLHILGSGCLFIILNIPLLLLLLVNYGYIDEIRGTYISIPKLLYWRSSEWGYDNLPIKLAALYSIYIEQTDFFIYSYITKFGLFYPFSLLFMILGVISLIQKLYYELKNKKIAYNLPMVLWLIIGIIYGIGIYPSPTRLNFLYFPLVWLIVLGITFFKKKVITSSIIAIYLCSFILFCYEYFNNYNKLAEREFSIGLEEALVFANSKREVKKYNIIITDGHTIYPRVLWHQKIPVNDYIRHSVWRNYPQAYLESAGFLHYRFEDGLNTEKISNDCIYITTKNNRYFLYNFNIEEFGRYIVAVPQN